MLFPIIFFGHAEMKKRGEREREWERERERWCRNYLTHSMWRISWEKLLASINCFSQRCMKIPRLSDFE